MYVQYGPYRHTDNLVGFSKQVSANLNPRTGQPLSHIHRVTMRGEVHGNDQAALRTAINNLQNAYSIQNQTWGLYHDDGSLSAHSLPSNALMVRPIRVVRPPSFPESSGAEYATRRTYEIELEAEYVSTTVNDLISFSESVSITGTGGPTYVMTPTLLGNPIGHQLTNRSVVYAVQSGSAVGWTGYPTYAVPPPIWPQVELVHLRENATESASRAGGIGTNFPLSWKYTFQSGVELWGFAHTP